MTIIFTLSITINVFLCGVMYNTLKSHEDYLINEYTSEIARSVRRRLLFWLSIVLSLTGVVAGFLFLIPNIPPLPSVKETTGAVISGGILVINIFCLILILLFKSPWGRFKYDSGDITRAIENKGGLQSLLLLSKLANNRYTKRDLAGWNASLLSLENVVSKLVLTKGKESKSEVESIISQAIDQLEKFNDSPPSVDYVIGFIDRLSRIAEIVRSNGYEKLTISIVIQLIDLSSIKGNKPWQLIDQKHAQWIGLVTLARLADEALKDSQDTIVEALINGISNSTVEARSSNIALQEGIYLNVIHFYHLIWVSSVRAPYPNIAKKAVDVLSSIGRACLELDKLWLAAICISNLQQFADSCISLPAKDKKYFSVQILKGLAFISRSSKPDQQSLVDQAVGVACSQVLNKCFSPAISRTFNEKLRFSRSYRALAEILQAYKEVGLLPVPKTKRLKT